MAKLRNPLLALRAHGSLGKALAFRHRDGTTIAEKRPYPKDAKTSAQLAWRTMYQLAVDLWHALSAAEKAEWESLGTARHMTGFAWFMSQTLRPNPGIYLPLAGGTMQGDINMDTHDILGNVSFPGKSGARAYLSANQLIGNGVPTPIIFDTESFDILGEFDAAVNHRFTAQKAGIYLVNITTSWDINAAGIRGTFIFANGAPFAGEYINAVVGLGTIGEATRICLLSIGDFLDFYAVQTSGGNLNLLGGVGATIMSVIKLA